MANANQNYNVQAAWLHILGDLIQSIGVIIISTIIYFEQDWKFLDPVLSILFSIIAVSFSIPVIRQIVSVLMDQTPSKIDIEKF